MSYFDVPTVLQLLGFTITSCLANLTQRPLIAREDLEV